MRQTSVARYRAACALAVSLIFVSIGPWVATAVPEEDPPVVTDDPPSFPSVEPSENTRVHLIVMSTGLCLDGEAPNNPARTKGCNDVNPNYKWDVVATADERGAMLKNVGNERCLRGEPDNSAWAKPCDKADDLQRWNLERSFPVEGRGGSSNEWVLLNYGSGMCLDGGTEPEDDAYTRPCKFNVPVYKWKVQILGSATT